MYYVKEMRLKSWLKNIFVFIPLVFSLELLNINKFWANSIAFVSFCLISSAVYVFNDICDAEKDATHAVKCNRPIASGKIKKRNAAVFAILLGVAGLALCFAVNCSTFIFAVVYLSLNIGYSLYLKKLPVFDCFCIAAGFILRVYAGGAAIHEPVSDWLFLTVVTMSLFMAFGKRRGELLKQENSDLTRDVLKNYGNVFLTGTIFMCSGLMVVFYSLWSVNRGGNMIYTVPLVIFIVARYLLIILDDNACDNACGDPTEVIFKDKSLLAFAFLYGLTMVILLYLG